MPTVQIANQRKAINIIFVMGHTVSQESGSKNNYKSSWERFDSRNEYRLKVPSHGIPMVRILSTYSSDNHEFWFGMKMLSGWSHSITILFFFLLKEMK